MLVTISGLVALVVVLPVLFLLLQLRQVGFSGIATLVFRQETGVLLWNTARLAVAVTVAAVAIGTSAAWVIERTDVPARTLWTVLLVLPLAIPDFVIGFGWVTAFPAVHGYWGSVLVMTLDLYPLVYLPVSAALRSADRMGEEVAWSLGLSRRGVFVRITLRQALPAIAGGGLLVALSLFAAFGAISILGYHTFATEIYNQFHLQFDTPAASALSLVLVLCSLFLIAGEGAIGGRGRLNRSTRQVTRDPVRRRLGLAKIPALLGLGATVGLGIGVPIGTLVYWMTQANTTTLPAATTLLDATFHSAGYAAAAAAAATVAAMPVAFATTHHRGRVSTLFARATLLVQALPGLVVALALVFFAVRYAFAVYQTTLLLVFAYVVLFFPLALVALRASILQSPIGLEEIGRSLGRSRFVVWTQITVPLIAPGIAAAFSIVFISTVTELTATLLLVPTGVSTLATQFWAFETNSAYSAASPYALVTVGLAALPCVGLARWFDRQTAVATIS